MTSSILRLKRKHWYTHACKATYMKSLTVADWLKADVINSKLPWQFGCLAWRRMNGKDTDEIIIEKGHLLFVQ